MKADLSV